jgi:hypothetical protein
MTREQIVQILEGEGGKLNGQVLTFRDEKEAACFISSPSEIMPIHRITKVELRDQLVLFQTSKDERFAFHCDDVLGFRFAATASAKDRPTGFGGR